MVICALSLLAAALLCWPHTAVRGRLFSERGVGWFPRAGVLPRVTPLLPVVAAVLGVTAAGLGGACAASALSVLVLWYRRERRCQRDRLAHASAFSQGLRLLVADLRAGAHPAAAAAGVAVDAPEAVAGVFRRLATTASLGGDVDRTVTAATTGPNAEGSCPAVPSSRTGESVLRRSRRISGSWWQCLLTLADPRVAGGSRSSPGTRRTGAACSGAFRPGLADATVEIPDGVRGSLGRVSRAWALAERHGIALAEVLDAVCRDVEHRVAFARDVEARMAGPRATAGVLSSLPLLGLALGEATGAKPWAVLSGQPLGQLVLVAGAGLICLGVVWTVRLTRTEVRR